MLRPDLVTTLRQCNRLAKSERLALSKIRVDGQGELWLNVHVAPVQPGSTGLPTAIGDALPVRMGRSVQLKEKFQDIRQVLQTWPELSTSANYLNVMCAGRPAYRTREVITQ
jgi:hypothetical protein